MKTRGAAEISRKASSDSMAAGSSKSTPSHGFSGEALDRFDQTVAWLARRQPRENPRVERTHHRETPCHGAGANRPGHSFGIRLANPVNTRFSPSRLRTAHPATQELGEPR